MAWIYLMIAGILEVVWAIGLKYADGFTRLWPSLFTIIMMLGSFFFLSQATRELPVGTAYAIWTGIGAIGTAVLAVFLFGEPMNAVRIICLMAIVAGMIGLKLTNP